MFALNRNSRIQTASGEQPMSKAVCFAADAFRRDLNHTCLESGLPGASVILRQGNLEKEMFRIQAEEERQEIEITASDDLGFIYGIYWLSRNILGVKDLWFWNDQIFRREDFHAVPENLSYTSEKAPVRFRGWFINDEVLLDHWNYKNDDSLKWQMVFETLLRMGGNMTIPGTDENSRTYDILASDMGLYISHHHAQPLGAEMFARAYPNEKPSILLHHDLFRGLWQEAIDRQKGMKVIWSLGFRGQGDYSFWDDDPSYDTDEKRGQLLSDVILEQYEMVHKQDPDAVCCTNLYGEVMDLYEKGCLHLPKDIIYIWSDNGYGKMVSRRQWNNNPRVPSLPEKGVGGRHGIYYHVSFYDLQAGAVLTMLPNGPSFVASELSKVMEHGASDYWMINASNIKPHTCYLDFIASVWRGENDLLASPDKHLDRYVTEYYGNGCTAEIKSLYHEFWEASVQYGEHSDEHAGEQFPNCLSRVLVSQYIADPAERSEYFLWCTPAESLKEQAEWFLQTTEAAERRYLQLRRKAEGLLSLLPEEERALFQESLLLQVEILHQSYRGAANAARSVLFGENKEFLSGFFHAGKAWEAFDEGNRLMRESEQGKWIGFYENDCQADLKQSAWVMEGLMAYLRAKGDGPHFYQWQKQFMESEKSRCVALLLNKENHPDNRTLYQAMKREYNDR